MVLLVAPRVFRAPLVCRAARCARGWRPAREPSAPRVDACCPAGVPGAGRASIETVIAFAGAGGASIETVIAFAGAGRASTETAIAFAGAKWVFLARFPAALVMMVSMVAVQGRAVVL